MPTLGDVFRCYVKPSLKGLLVIRKKTTIQTSARLEAAKRRVAEHTNLSDYPARLAHEECVKNGWARKVRKYIPGKGYEEVDVCPIEKFRVLLRKYMKMVHGTATAAAK